MAPEVVLGGQYDNKIDVFSFAIVMYEILFETVEPYGSDTNKYGIEFAVAQDKNLRPKVEISNDIFNRFDIPSMNALENVVELMKNCWGHDPKLRPNFREIVNTLTQIRESLNGINDICFPIVPDD